MQHSEGGIGLGTDLGSIEMKERELRGLIGKVKAGKLSRRGFVQAMMAVGIGAPAASQILLSSGVAMAQPPLRSSRT